MGINPGDWIAWAVNVINVKILIEMIVTNVTIIADFIKLFFLNLT